MRLSLESNLIGNLGLIGLSKAMIDNESLEELYLYNNEIDDDAIDAFFEGLRDREDAPRPQKVVEELSSLVHLPLKLNNEIM